MSETVSEGRQKTEAKPLSQILMPILIGLAAEVLIGAIKSMPPEMRLLSVLVIGLVYGGLTNGLGIKALPLSRRASFFLALLFLLGFVLIIFASVILNLDLMQTAVLLGCLVVMALSLLVVGALPQSVSLLRSFLTGAATFSLGAALAIGGAPVVDLVTSIDTDNGLTIINDCDTSLINPDLGLDVPAHKQQYLEDVPPVSFSLERRGNELIAGGMATSLIRKSGSKVPFNSSVDICKKIWVDGQLLEPGSSVELRMNERRNHTIHIDCSGCP
ncbi:MAG: hypothetical protein ACP5OU_04520, partial [Methanothrix sp.]